jgi:hypothetical protein
MEFEKYQHIQRIGTTAVEGIEQGMCYIFPKLDGTNGSMWNENDYLTCGSRNRKLTSDNDNAGFYNTVSEKDGYSFIDFFIDNPDLRLFGEWLVPHTLKTYKDDAWRIFYVFDVMDKDGNYMIYEEYKELLEKYGIDYIPAICKIKNPTYERIVGQLEKNTFLIKDGEGSGEGVVIKNYDFTNKFGNTIWAKLVRNDFKTAHGKKELCELKEKSMVEEEIVNKFVTTMLIDKEYAKIVNDNDGWESKFIPQLLNTVYYCLITEEMWNVLKKFKHPVINFRTLMHFTTTKIKESKPELF